MMKVLRLTPTEPLLVMLHWLSMDYWIKYKLVIVTFKALTIRQPTYLTNLLDHHVAVQHTRFATHDSLIIPPIPTKMASLTFEHVEPTFWKFIIRC